MTFFFALEKKIALSIQRHKRHDLPILSFQLEHKEGHYATSHSTPPWTRENDFSVGFLSYQNASQDLFFCLKVFCQLILSACPPTLTSYA